MADTSPGVLLIILILLHEVGFFLAMNTFLQSEIVKMYVWQDDIGQQFQSIMRPVRQIYYWGFVLIPFIISVKIIVVALFVQLPLLFNSIMICFKQIFRVIVWGGFITGAGELTRVLKMYFVHSPDHDFSISHYTPFGILDIIEIEKYKAPSLVLLNYFNIFEVAWLVTVFSGLYMMPKVRKEDAFVITAGVWIFIVSLQWAVTFYMYEILGMSR